MNHKREKKNAAALLKLREMKTQVAALKKAACLREQKAAFEEMRQAEKQAEDCEKTRNQNAHAAMQNICQKDSIQRTDLEYEYETFSWASEKLKELRQVVVEKKEAHTQRLDETNRAREEHIYCENKTDQAARLHDKAKRAHVQHLLYLESEENEEVATIRHILNTARSS